MTHLICYHGLPDTVQQDINQWIYHLWPDTVNHEQPLVMLYDAAHPPSDNSQLRQIAIVRQNHPQPEGDLQLHAPFHLSSLFSLLQPLIDRASHAAQLDLWDHWEYDASLRELTHSTRASIPLTDKEAQLLELLHQQQPNAIGKAALLQAIWGYDPEANTHTLETHIYRLRQKLEATQGEHFRNKGIITEADGYRFVG